MKKIIIMCAIGFCLQTTTQAQNLLKSAGSTAYASKFSSIFGGLKSKLGGILTATQMTKFMGMKPKTNDVTNVMSNLFY